MVLLQHHGGHRALRLLISRLSGRTALTALTALALPSSCGGGGAPSAISESASAITNGAPTHGDLGVAALVKGGALVCSATLVAPRVLLTAAHCVPDGAPPDAVFGATLASGTVLHIIAVKRHPSFDETKLTDDVAMALLDDTPPAGAKPWPLATTALDARSVGLALRLVGFGATGPADTTPPQKRVGTSSVASLTTNEIALASSPSQTCSGDSGGPAFAMVGGVEAIVGVTSSGDPACSQTARDMRVDAYASFILPWLAATAEGAAGPGDRCFYAASCAPSAGECAAALDDASLSFCAPSCGANDACPAGLACLAGTDARKLCRHASPSPGTFGASCRDASDCALGKCLAPASGGGTVCTTTCFPDLPGFCKGGSRCATVAAASGAYACFVPGPPAASSGCSVGGEAAGGSWLVALALSATFARRRRR